MRSSGGLSLMLLFTVGLGGCVVRTTTAGTTWGYPAAPAPDWVRPGYVESIREVIHREEGDPAGGAVAGAIIGGLLGSGRGGPGPLFGAAAGATVGAAASQGSRESRSYEVTVRFDDGGRQLFVYGGYSPFRPGEPVLMTPSGLARR
jgi:outer membrane lipoprotein SlyB